MFTSLRFLNGNSLFYLCIFLLALWHSGASFEVSNRPVTEDCLECLCEAMSGCNATEICVNGACGIFRITWGYWIEAGQLTLSNDTTLNEEAFTNCVNEPRCAADTVQSYMYKHGQDCNGDDLINCLDYGSLHKMGNLKCRAEVPNSFGSVFYKCLKLKEKQEKMKKPILTHI
ncbi:uncharacterized protein Dwil_GK22028 [Drosophila willistoni]|uniref:lysozyme n=1 Tax=Drosophila willistoni TaxID=7260 RepID=B4MR91_DROWI|nr:lysozyme 2 [Drosophila willistoni]EDW74630.1 uncharacterized protein Dwil_GK22028 [Drosophila willistoni]